MGIHRIGSNRGDVWWNQDWNMETADSSYACRFRYDSVIGRLISQGCA